MDKKISFEAGYYTYFKNPCLDDNRRLKQRFLSSFSLYVLQEVICQMWVHQPFTSCQHALQTAFIFRFHLSVRNKKMKLLQAILKTGIGWFFKVREGDGVHQSLQYQFISQSLVICVLLYHIARYRRCIK